MSSKKRNCHFWTPNLNFVWHFNILILLDNSLRIAYYNDNLGSCRWALRVLAASLHQACFFPPLTVNTNSNSSEARRLPSPSRRVLSELLNNRVCCVSQISKKPVFIRINWSSWDNSWNPARYVTISQHTRLLGRHPGKWLSTVWAHLPVFLFGVDRPMFQGDDILAMISHTIVFSVSRFSWWTLGWSHSSVLGTALMWVLSQCSDSSQVGGLGKPVNNTLFDELKSGSQSQRNCTQDKIHTAQSIHDVTVTEITELCTVHFMWRVSFHYINKTMKLPYLVPVLRTLQHVVY